MNVPFHKSFFFYALNRTNFGITYALYIKTTRVMSLILLTERAEDNWVLVTTTNNYSYKRQIMGFVNRAFSPEPKTDRKTLSQTSNVKPQIKYVALNNLEEPG